MARHWVAAQFACVHHLPLLLIARELGLLLFPPGVACIALGCARFQVKLGLAAACGVLRAQKLRARFLRVARAGVGVPDAAVARVPWQRARDTAGSVVAIHIIARVVLACGAAVAVATLAAVAVAGILASAMISAIVVVLARGLVANGSAPLAVAIAAATFRRRTFRVRPVALAVRAVAIIHASQAEAAAEEHPGSCASRCPHFAYMPALLHVSAHSRHRSPGTSSRQPEAA